MKLLTVQNAKTTKGEALGYLTGILYLAPYNIAKKDVNVCPASTRGCRASCLYFAGRGAFKSTQRARVNKTLQFINNQKAFIDQLRKDIKALERKALREGLKPCVRLNGTSDIKWEKIAPELFAEFNHIKFYDYTKILDRDTPNNYHLTISRSECNEAYLINQKYNIAIVFDILPKTYKNKLVIDGTMHDCRFLDPQNVIVGLISKGKAKKDIKNFVVRSRELYEDR